VRVRTGNIQIIKTHMPPCAFDEGMRFEIFDRHGHQVTRHSIGSHWRGSCQTVYWLSIQLFIQANHISATLLGPIATGGNALPMYSSQVSAGFPSPAADHLVKLISLDELFEIRAPHVYLAKISGDSMQGAGIFNGDLVIVDRSKTAQHGDIVIAALNAEFV